MAGGISLFCFAANDSLNRPLSPAVGLSHSRDGGLV